MPQRPLVAGDASYLAFRGLLRQAAELNYGDRLSNEDGRLRGAPALLTNADIADGISGITANRK